MLKYPMASTFRFLLVTFMLISCVASKCGDAQGPLTVPELEHALHHAQTMEELDKLEERAKKLGSHTQIEIINYKRTELRKKADEARKNAEKATLSAKIAAARTPADLDLIEDEAKNAGLEQEHEWQHRIEALRLAECEATGDVGQLIHLTRKALSRKDAYSQLQCWTKLHNHVREAANVLAVECRSATTGAQLRSIKRRIDAAKHVYDEIAKEDTYQELEKLGMQIGNDQHKKSSASFQAKWEQGLSEYLNVAYNSCEFRVQILASPKVDFLDYHCKPEKRSWFSGTPLPDRCDEANNIRKDCFKEAHDYVELMAGYRMRGSDKNWGNDAIRIVIEKLKADFPECKTKLHELEAYATQMKTTPLELPAPQQD